MPFRRNEVLNKKNEYFMQIKAIKYFK